MSFQDPTKMENLRAQGIIVGNPLISKTLLARICSVITSCHSELSDAACESGILATSGIGLQLGLADGSTNPFSQIVQAETDGLLRSDSAAADNCASDLQKLNCADPLVQNAYNSTATNPFASVTFMIPTSPGSCPAVFAPSARKDYYVATTGSDLNDGSAEKPWATISHAAQSLVLGTEGATVHVAPGNYQPPTSATCVGPYPNANSCGLWTARSGTASAPIVYVSDQMWGAKIIPADAYSAWYNSGDYVSIVGFEIIGNKGTNIGIQNDGSFVRVESNNVHGIPSAAACVSGIGGGGISHTNPSAHDNDTVRNVVHDIGPFPGNGLSASSYCNHAHGIYYHHPRGNIQNNMIYRVGSWGISSWSTASYLNITNNLLYNNGSRDNTGTLIGGAITIAAAAGNTHDYSTISNNIIRNNTAEGIDNHFNSGTHNLYSNNIFYANGRNMDFVAGTVDFGSILADPMMIDFKIDGTGDYRLQGPSSPAVNAGTKTCASGSNCTPDKDYSGFLRPYDTNLDIGPLEWHP